MPKRVAYGAGVGRRPPPAASCGPVVTYSNFIGHAPGRRGYPVHPRGRGGGHRSPISRSGGHRRPTGRSPRGGDTRGCPRRSSEPTAECQAGPAQGSRAGETSRRGPAPPGACRAQPPPDPADCCRGRCRPAAPSRRLPPSADPSTCRPAGACRPRPRPTRQPADPPGRATAGASPATRRSPRTPPPPAPGTPRTAPPGPPRPTRAVRPRTRPRAAPAPSPPPSAPC